MSIQQKSSKKALNLTSEDENHLYSIYLEEFNDYYHTIFINLPMKFLSNISRSAKLYNDKKFNVFSSSTINKVEDYFTLEVYSKESKLAYTIIKAIKSKLDTNPSLAPFQGNYLPHCKDNHSPPIHSCGKQFYSFIHKRSGDDQQKKETYLICAYCEEIYKNTFVKFHCAQCSSDFYSKTINEEDSENKYQLATWEKYHCNVLLNDYMKCIKCFAPFYIDIETHATSKQLICLKCSFTIEQSEISWKCILCQKGFVCDAKAYNPLEYKNMKLCVKEALLNKIKARPESLPCCGNIEALMKFTHNAKCRGELLLGEMNRKKIVVCGKCEAFNNYETYSWICPKCDQRFSLNEQQDNHQQHQSQHKREPITPIRCQSNNKRLMKFNSSEQLVNKKNENEPEAIETPFDLVKDKKRMSSLKKKNEGLVSLTKEEEEDNAYAKSSRKSMKKNDIPKYPFQPVKMNLNKKFSGMKINYEEDNTTTIPINEEDKMKEDQQTIGRNSYENNTNLFSTASSNIQSDTSNSNSLIQLKSNNESLKRNKDADQPKVSTPRLVSLSANSSNFEINNYKIIKLIGSGSFGKIYNVLSPDGTFYAMKKIVGASMEELESLKAEHEILLSLHKKNSNLNLVSVTGIQTKQLDTTTFVMYVLMDLAEMDWDKEISNRFKTKSYYTEKELIAIISSLIKTFAYLQRHNISHRDIKPQNILVFSSGTKYKLSDFGEAKILQSDLPDTNKQTLRGTELYMSPVLFKALRNKVVDLKYVEHNTYKSDVFSFGLCVLYAATLTVQSLNEIREIYNMLTIKRSLNKFLQAKYSQSFINIMLKMLDMNEKTRSDFLDLEKEINNYCI